jgi:hypothetical protein
MDDLVGRVEQHEFVLDFAGHQITAMQRVDCTHDRAS